MFRHLAIILAACAALSACTKNSGAPENSVSFPLRINLKSLDATQGGSDEATAEVVQNLYEGLLQYHYLKRPLVVIPQLSDGMPVVSKDGLTHTFKIKKGVRFHDNEAFPGGKGREVTAEDFIYSFKRIADIKNKSDGFWIFEGKVKGINEWREKLSKGEIKFEAPIEGLQAPDPNTLVIKLTAPYYQLHYVLTMGYAGVVPHEAVEKYGEEFMNHPVGTGPFMFESWIRGNKVVLKKNPTFHGETYPTDGNPEDKDNGMLADAGKPLPFVDKLVFYEYPEDQPRWLNLMKGNVDMSEIPKDNFDSAIENGALKPALATKGFQLQRYPRPEVVYYAFNMVDPLLGKNLHLRRALALAYDWKTAAEKFYNNRVISAQSPLPPGLDGYDENFVNPWKQHDLEKAKEELKKAGFPGGKGLPVIEISDSSSTTSRQMAEFLTHNFEQIGVKLSVQANSWPQFQDRIRNKKAQMFGIAWNADYPDPQNMYQILYGPAISPGPNNANFQNKEFDKLYEAALKLPSGPERTKIYQKMRDVFVQEMPWIPTFHRLGYYVVNGWVENYRKDATRHGEYKYVKINLEKKKQLKEKL